MTAAADPAAEAAALTHYAWAKVNLTLRVTGRRADGYHELDSLVVFAGVGDALEVVPADDLELHVAGPFAEAIPQGADNLVLRAASALREHFSVAAGARIGLVKSLPTAAGIGGGSADAAATLEALARLWQIVPRADELQAIALSLGADVPVCLFGRPAFVGGIGERIERAPPLPTAWLLLANPRIALATPAVFKARSGPFSPPARWSEVDADAESLAERLRAAGNDLEAPARGLVPDIGAVLTALGGLPDCLLSRMSGSGATCFGLFAGRAEATAAEKALSAARPDWWVAAAPLLHGRLERPWW